MDKSKVETVKFFSSALSKEMSLCVYMPNEYSESRPLPVLYFLHGRSGSERFMQYIGLDAFADAMMGNGEIAPFIIVSPNLENSRGINSAAACAEVLDVAGRTINVGRYEDYFINEVIPLVDRTFSTIKSREGRFVGGVSAGGYAALHYAFRHCGLFSKVGGHMPAIELTLDDEDKPYFSESGTWEKYNPLSIAVQLKPATPLSVYLDAGDSDEGHFYDGCAALYKLLSAKQIRSENHIFVGHHNAEYVMANMGKYLKFYGSCL